MSRHPSLGAFLGLASLAALLAATAALGGECIDAAVGQYKDCKADCREQFQVDKDACLNRDHACVEACRADREDCREATGYDAAIDQCNATRDAAIQSCKQIYPPGTSRDTCIDNAQVDGFRCRDQVREDKRDPLRACRLQFRACAKACPPADPNPDPNEEVIDKRQCRRDAKQVFKGCLVICREDFQIAKDACRNKDHACVEQCRTDREACRAPVLAELAADIAVCNAERDQAIQSCKSTYPTPGPAQDACIDQAQVVAFQCRDQAREDARPGLKPCRDAFRACVTACPPASPSGAFLDGDSLL